jgi:GAF domain-containing protein/HAMP domain-containing protein
MIERFLRRLSVRRRIVSAFLILMFLLALPVPLIVANQSLLLSRLRQITEVETYADRLLLRASARVESSRVNLMRYAQDYALSTYEAKDDVDQAVQFLTEAQNLITAPEQKSVVAEVLTALADYRALVGDVEVVRSEEGEQNTSRNLFQASRLGNSIAQRIEQIVNDSEARVAMANEAAYREAQDRLILLGLAYVTVLIVALILAFLVQRSITHPIAELRTAAESFRQGEMNVTVPVVGSDELSLFAETFNEMAAQSRELIATLEQRVADRTRDLERRAVQLATAADVGRAAVSILELETLTHQVVELVCERFGLYYVGLFLLDQAGNGSGEQYAVLEAGTGEAGRIMREQGHKLQIGGVSMVGAACAQRQARIALDIGEEPVRFSNPLLPDTRSEMVLPLMVGDRVLGALDVQSTQPNAFSTEDVAVLQLVADQVAVAVDNARKFLEEATLLEATNPFYRISHRLTTATSVSDVLDMIVFSVKETDADGCVIGLLEPTGSAAPEYIHLVRTWCRDKPSAIPVGMRMDAREDPKLVEAFAGVWIASDLDEITHLPEHSRHFVEQMEAQAVAHFPLQVGREQVGVLLIYRTVAGAFPDTILRLYETLSEQASVALERARLLETTRRRAEEEAALRALSDRIARAMDVESVLHSAVEGLNQALWASGVCVELGSLEPTDDPESQA